MGVKLGDALVYMRGDSGPLEKDLAEGKKKTTVWTQAVGVAVGNLMSNAIAGGVKLATGAVKTLGKELLFLTMDAAKLESTSNTFKNLAESIGGDAAEAMEQLRTATRGMIADADLMQAGNKFLAMGLAETTQGAADLAEMATQLGTAMGEDATSSMENFALMMANQSIPRLDSFGISSSKVRERILELMEATEGMTREAAFNQAVMEQGRITMKKVGEQAGTSAAKIARMRAVFENLKLKVGQALQPILDAIVNIGSALVDKYGPKIEEWLGRLKGPMTDLGEALKFLVDGDFDSFFGALSDALIALGVPEDTIGKWYWAVKDFGAAIQAWKDGDAEGVVGNVMLALAGLGVPPKTLEKLREPFTKITQWIMDIPENLKWLQNAFWIWWGMHGQPFIDTVKAGFVDAMTEWGKMKEALGERFSGPLERLNTAFGNLITTLGIGGGDGDGYLGTFFRNLADILVAGQIDFLLKPINDAIDDLTKALDSVSQAIEWLRENGVFDWLREQFAWLAGATLPPWLTPGSPTPFELGLRGITDAMTDLNSMGIPQLQAAFGGLGQSNQDNRRNVTVYGGVQNYQTPGMGNPLEQLWELGTT